MIMLVLGAAIGLLVSRTVIATKLYTLVAKHISFLPRA